MGKKGEREKGERRTIHPFVGVHGAVPEVLPGVAEEDGEAEAGSGLEDPVDGFREPDVQSGVSGWCYRLEDVLDHCESLVDIRYRRGLGAKRSYDALCIDPQGRECPGQKDITSSMDPSSPGGNIVIFPTVQVSWVGEVTNAKT